MTEIHPFESFVPDSCEVLVLGSFPGRESTQMKREDDWFYGANRNQFWKIIELVYDVKLKNKADKQKLFRDMRIGITDIISSCERRENRNSDDNLINRIFNSKIVDILKANPIKRVLFTSKYVHQEFAENFPKPIEVELVTLPSPSPMYRSLKIVDKAAIYKKHFPVK